MSQGTFTPNMNLLSPFVLKLQTQTAHTGWHIKSMHSLRIYLYWFSLSLVLWLIDYSCYGENVLKQRLLSDLQALTDQWWWYISTRWRTICEKLSTFCNSCTHRPSLNLKTGLPNCLNALMLVHWQQIWDVEHLKDVLVTCWERISWEFIDRAIRKFLKRLVSIIAVNSGHVEHFFDFSLL